MPITDGRVLDHQAILTRRSMRRVANLERESGRMPVHERPVAIPEMSQQSALYVFGRTNVNPLVRVRDPIDSGRQRRERLDSLSREWTRDQMVKGHTATSRSQV